MSSSNNSFSESLEFLLNKAKCQGASSADAVIVSSSSTSVSIRKGELEDLERSENNDVGLRVFVGQRQAIVSSSDTREAALDTLAERAVEMAKVAPPDPWATIATRDQLSKNPNKDLDLYDKTELSADKLKEMAQEVEAAALEVEGVVQAEGASAGWGQGGMALATSNGFYGSYKSSSFSTSISALAGTGLAMERDYDYSSVHHFKDLGEPSVIGKLAGERAISRLNPRKVDTTQVPIIFGPRVSNTLLGHLSGAINGRGIARGTSFLKDQMHKPIFRKGVTIKDDPTRLKGLNSKPFDGEGLETTPQTFIEDGVLRSWVLDLASAKQLGLISNGHASKGTSSPPGPSTSNFYMAIGNVSPEDLIKDIKAGFYVTELIGMGVNGITGDYSRGATGFWIENGVISYPVSEITIAGNLKNMFMELTPASDLEFKYGTDAPSVRIEGMMLAGA
ncbi:MAG: TldD/PmbA family protein [Sphingomonadales bacterium]|jgi:PmbA protein